MSQSCTVHLARGVHMPRSIWDCNHRSWVAVNETYIRMPKNRGYRDTVLMPSDGWHWEACFLNKHLLSKTTSSCSQKWFNLPTPLQLQQTFSKKHYNTLQLDHLHSSWERFSHHSKPEKVLRNSFSTLNLFVASRYTSFQHYKKHCENDRCHLFPVMFFWTLIFLTTKVQTCSSKNQAYVFFQFVICFTLPANPPPKKKKHQIIWESELASFSSSAAASLSWGFENKMSRCQKIGQLECNQSISHQVDLIFSNGISHKWDFLDVKIRVARFGKLVLSAVCTKSHQRVEQSLESLEFFRKCLDCMNSNVKITIWIYTNSQLLHH